MKKQLAICIVAAGLISMPQSVTAQGFLGKVNKALDNATDCYGAGRAAD